jgi:hypothetical protein
MVKLLVSYELTNDAVVKHTSGNQPTRTEVIARPAVRAHLILSDTKDPDLKHLGFVHVKIQAEPESVSTLAGMTPDQAADWLCTAIKRAL